MARDSVAVIIPAAGKGVRLGSRQSKIFVPVAGAPIILHTLRACERAPSVRWIVIAVQLTDRPRLQALLRRARLKKIVTVVLGGASRAESVACGVSALPADASWVLIHDAARPCISTALIEQSIRQAKRHGGVACGLPASLTVKAVDASQQVRLTLDRDSLWFMQTPQLFRRAWLVEALSRVNGTLHHFPDDAALVEWAGYPVHLVPGDPLNIKVTTKEDLLLAETILRHRR